MAGFAAKFCAEPRSGGPKRIYGDPVGGKLVSSWVPGLACTLFFHLVWPHNVADSNGVATQCC